MKYINFIPRNSLAESLVPPPKPAKSFIPEWYKKIPSMHNDSVSKPRPSTVKRCMPFLDSFTTGYIQELWCDLYFEVTEDKLNNTFSIVYNWAENIKPISSRAEDHNNSELLPKSSQFWPTEFQWETQWEPELPSGYSALYIHPLNRYDLPFLTLSGIVDTDKYPVPGPLPFFLKSDFTGMIPAGTPMYQIIPIKREDWQSNKSKYNEEKNKKLSFNVKKYFYNGYKNVIWEKKDYK
jgi:hypothetical protein